MNIAIVGGRDFNDYELMSLCIYDHTKIGEYIEMSKSMDDFKVTIISGGAKGADNLAKRYAGEFETNYVEFPADWNKHGKAAGPIRNQQIVDAADIIIVFWDGTSKETKDTIDKARKAKKHTMIFYY